MLPTLKRRVDFVRISKFGKSFVCKLFILKAMVRIPDAGVAYVGFTASRKVGNAVIRNRAKRRARWAVRILGSGYFDDGHNYSLICRNSIIKCPFDNIVCFLRKACVSLRKDLST